MTPQEVQNLLPHQQRVVTEHSELQAKISLLENFLRTATFQHLSLVEQNMLHLQLTVMRLYAEVLKQRIAYFMRQKT